MAKVWMPVEAETEILCDCDNSSQCTEQLRVESDSCISFENDAGYWSIELPDDLRLCRLTDAPGDMPAEVRATMREALTKQRAVIERRADTVERYGIDRSVFTDELAAIDAALAWLDAQEGAK